MLGGAGLVAGSVVTLVGPVRLAGATTTTAANKIAIAASDIQAINLNQTANTTSTKPVTLFSTTFKTSTTEDLLMDVHLECGLYTAVGATGGGSGSKTSSTATGSVVVWLVLDGHLLPTTLTDTASSNPPTLDSNGIPTTDNGPVNFCNRQFNLSTQNLSTSEMLTLFINTKDANAFQWFALNVGNGTHILTAYADLFAATSCSGTLGTGCGTTINYITPAASALVGQRTMSVEPDHLANSATF
jgi:hypothetical protein